MNWHTGLSIILLAACSSAPPDTDRKEVVTRSWPAATTEVRTIRFDDDGARILWASAARLGWMNLDTGETGEAGTGESAAGDVVAAMFSHTGDRVFLATGRVLASYFLDGGEVETIAECDGPIAALAVHPLETHAIVVTRSGKRREIALVDRRWHEQPVGPWWIDAIYSRDGDAVIAAADDRIYELRRAEAGLMPPRLLLDATEIGVTCLARGSGDSILFGGFGGVYCLTPGEPGPQRLGAGTETPMTWTTRLASSRDGQVIAAADTGVIRVWRIGDDLTPRLNIEQAWEATADSGRAREPIGCLAVAPDGRWVVAGCGVPGPRTIWHHEVDNADRTPQPAALPAVR
ncbi:MAG: hypothetical protein KDC98_07545 [Planctomycetes bacterium]|nr:hypothetical protein [Planctomycetota bacterium]